MHSDRAPNFGRYQVLAEVGRGAMGVVYKAHDPKIDRVVALKTIILSERQSPEEKQFRERFLVEARAAGRLTHPSIVTVHDVGEDTKTQNPFIVMEYVEGESLEKQLSDLGGEFPPECAFNLVQELAGALDYAHSQGIVHRDIKPGNILLTKDGRSKITDFGVAKLNTAYQTVAGQSLGTPAYMSPEQLNGDVVDGRSDLFSLGVILYTLLTGHRPFQGNSAMTVSFRVVHRDPLPVSAYDSDFPPDVDYVIGRAMAKDPAHRYQTGKELADDLTDLQEGATPRSKQSDPAAPVPSAREDRGHVPLRRPGLTAGKSSTPSPSPVTAHPASHPSKWEYAILAVLACGVAVMGIALFLPSHKIPLFGGHVSLSPSPNLSEIRPNSSAAANFTPISEKSPVLLSSSESKKVPVAGLPNRAPNTNASRPRNSVAVVASESQPGVLRPVATVAARNTASLHIRVEHRFPSAEVLVWIDDKLAYKAAVDGTVKRHIGMFKTVAGYKSDSLQLAAGEHHIRVRVESSDNSYDRTQTITGIVPEDSERALKIDCTNRKQIHVELE
jgi:serine/threonine protein kinase